VHRGIDAIDPKPTWAGSKFAVQQASHRDAVQLGLVASLARPGKNVTGVTSLAPELAIRQQRSFSASRL